MLVEVSKKAEELSGVGLSLSRIAFIVSGNWYPGEKRGAGNYVITITIIIIIMAIIMVIIIIIIMVLGKTLDA